jgi:hypothetical protein
MCMFFRCMYIKHIVVTQIHVILLFYRPGQSHNYTVCKVLVAGACQKYIEGFLIRFWPTRHMQRRSFCVCSPFCAILLSIIFCACSPFCAICSVDHFLCLLSILRHMQRRSFFVPALDIGLASSCVQIKSHAFFPWIHIPSRHSWPV